MTYSAPWPAPPQIGTLGSVQLVGDVQTDWENPEINPLSGSTTYDAIGRDMRDRMLARYPAARFQMGDINDTTLNGALDPAILKRRFALFETWCAKYDIEMFKVMGNHDVIDGVLSPQQWADYFGYPSPSYTVDDLGEFRVVVLGPTRSMKTPSGWPDSGTASGVRPLTSAEVTWLDTTLAADTRPTVVLNHAPFAFEPTAFGVGDWWKNQSTLAEGVAATSLLQVLDAHPHVIAWAHGHTHSVWYDNVKPNTGLMSVGARKIARIDAGATYTQPSTAPQEVGRGLPVTFYVSVLDDGRTVEVRYRDHGSRLWGAPSGMGRVHRLTAG